MKRGDLEQCAREVRRAFEAPTARVTLRRAMLAEGFGSAWFKWSVQQTLSAATRRLVHSQAEQSASCARAA